MISAIVTESREPYLLCRCVYSQKIFPLQFNWIMFHKKKPIVQRRIQSDYCQMSHCNACWCCLCAKGLSCFKSSYEPLCIQPVQCQRATHKTQTTETISSKCRGIKDTQSYMTLSPISLSCFIAGKSIDDITKMGWCHILSCVFT